MKSYNQLMVSLGLPLATIQVLGREIHRINSGLYDASYHWGFPPALMPLYCDCDLFVYTGYWKHWFSSRDVTIVEMAPEEMEEVARSFEQLSRRLLFESLGNSRQPKEATVKLASSLSITDLQMIIALRREKGIDPKALLNLPVFSRDPPASLATGPENYKGEFPVHWNLEELLARGDVAGLEVLGVEHVKRKARSLRDRVPWLLSSSPQGTFRACLKKDDIHGAWMSLNSPGWSLLQAANALRELGDAVNDPQFQCLVDAWTHENSHRDNGY